MTYIILAAGKGNNLHPLTLKYTKTSYKLDEETTVLQRMVRTIRKADKNAEIVVVVGFKAESIREEIEGENVKFVLNPFYEVTNSISSLWFARDYLERENVAIVHGDVVFSNEIVNKYLTKETAYPYVLVELDPVSSRLLKQEIDSMVNSNMYDQYFEDSLVQMIMFHDFQLFCEDIAGMKWSEVDSVDDLLTAQEIHRESR